MAGEASCLTGLWLSKPDPETGGSPDGRDEPSASPHGRGHEGPLSPATQRCYVHAVAKFSKYFGRSPDQLGLAEVRAYQVHLVSAGVSWGAFNQAVCALRFFFGVTLSRAAMFERIPYARKPQRLPVVLSAARSCSSWASRVWP